MAKSRTECIRDCTAQYRQDLKRMSRSEASTRRRRCIDRCGEPPEEPIKTVYCCKGWKHGVLVKVQSPKPCSGKWVPCDGPDPPKPQGCTSDDDCAGNKKCIDGDCVKIYTPPVKECETDADCGAGHFCGDDNKCHKKLVTSECETDADCPEGFECDPSGNCIKKSVDDDKDDDKDDGNGNGGDGDGGDSSPGSEFKWSGGLSDALQGMLGQYNKLSSAEYPGGEFEWSGMTQEAMQKLADRYNYLMENPRGTTDAERQAIINFATERIKRGERGQMQSMVDRLSRMGMAGSGFQESEARAIGRGTREDVVSLQRQVAMDELDRRFTELMGGTQMAQGLLGTMMQGEQIPEALTMDRKDQWLRELLGKSGESRGMLSTLMTGEQIPEVLSAARRGEGTTAMQQLLAYMNMIMGSYGQGSSWLQGILG